MFATGPVGLVVYLCDDTHGWANGLPYTTSRYVLARITASTVQPKPRGARTKSRYFKTDFVLIENGPHVHRDG